MTTGVLGGLALLAAAPAGAPLPLRARGRVGPARAFSPPPHRLLPQGSRGAEGQGAPGVRRAVDASEDDGAVRAVPERSQGGVRQSVGLGAAVPVTCRPAPGRRGPWRPRAPDPLPAPAERLCAVGGERSHTAGGQAGGVARATGDATRRPHRPQDVCTLALQNHALAMQAWLPCAPGGLSHRTRATEPKRRRPPCAAGSSAVAPPAQRSSAVCRPPRRARMGA